MMTPVPPRVYLQDICLRHKFIRSKEADNVYERPERIRAINIGIAATYARLEQANPGLLTNGDKSKAPNSTINGPLTIVRSAATLDMRVHNASLAVHSGDDDDGNQWFLADDIEEVCVDSINKIQRNQSEIPKKWEQDLYLCPESFDAFEAAIGTVCEAVDDVCRATGVAHERSKAASKDYREVGHPSPRAFVVIRPPGHHCGEDSPAGFGFVNNVAVGAFHAFEEHRLSRIVIFDYDLHHGNGTQEIVRAFQAPRIYYGSMHDILSYPCEAGNQELISDASLQLHGVDDEWIHNVHLQPYKTEEEFWIHYKERYSTLFTKAEEFLQSTGGGGDDVIVFLSCGFDASEYETTEMSRHDRHVPTSFYHHFTREACAFADKWAGGRLISVLEGGYSDKALTSGAISHLSGLAEAGGLRIDKRWWSPDDLNLIEKVTSKRRGRKPKLDHFDWWLQRMQQIFQNINKETPPPAALPQSQLFVPPTPPVMRDDAPESTPVRTRRRRTKRPLPPPTAMVTRKSKRASPDDHEYMQLPAQKRMRRSQARKEEEEEGESPTDDSLSSEEPDTPSEPRADNGKERNVSPPEQTNVRSSVDKGEVYNGQPPTHSTSGLPTPLPSLDDVIAKPANSKGTVAASTLNPAVPASAEKLKATARQTQVSATITSEANGSSTPATTQKELHISTSGSTSTPHPVSTLTTTAISASQADARPSSPAATKSTVDPPVASPSSAPQRTPAPSSQPSKPTAAPLSTAFAFVQQKKPLQSSSQPSQPPASSQSTTSPRVQTSAQTASPSTTTRSPLIPTSALSNRTTTPNGAPRSLDKSSAPISGRLPDRVAFESLFQAQMDRVALSSREMRLMTDSALPTLERKLSSLTPRIQSLLDDMTALKEKLAEL